MRIYSDNYNIVQVDGHPIHNKDPYNGYYKSLWTIGWLAPINGY